MKSTEELTQEIFAASQADLGRAHVSEGMGCLDAPQELFAVVRNNLKYARKVVRIYERFLKKYESQQSGTVTTTKGGDQC